MPLDDDARRRGAETKRQRTHNAILKAVWDIPRVEDVTYAEVAQRAGVSEATVFRYFPTREELLVKAIYGLWVGDVFKKPPTEFGIQFYVDQLRAALGPVALPLWQQNMRRVVEEGGLSRRDVADHVLDWLIMTPGDQFPAGPRTPIETLDPDVDDYPHLS